MKLIGLMVAVLLTWTTFGGSATGAAEATNETKSQRDARMGWWRDARFGMFIHWGIYAVPADGEWYLQSHHVPLGEYAKYAGQFNPVKFDADRWARIAHDAGMKYLVITSKHHDGFCMFKTATTKYNVVDATPWHFDPLAALSDACKRHGVRFCCYYSIMDWHSPDQAPAKADPRRPEYNPTSFPTPEKKAAYVAYMKAQLKDLIDQYHPGLLWFDGGWMNGWTGEDGKDLIAYLHGLDPQLIVNDRPGGGGDYGTPEQTIPASGNGKDWETCMTINGNWGFAAHDHGFKPTRVLLTNLVDIVSKGGNYLLNVGPTPDGVIPQEEVDRLEEIGRWLKTNGDAIYGAKAGPFKHHPAWGRATQKSGKLYLEVFDWPANGELAVPLQNGVKACRLLADPSRTFEVSHTGDGAVVHLTGPAPDKLCSVLELEIEGEPAAVETSLRQRPDGSVVLDVGDATLGADSPAVESKGGQDNLGFWMNRQGTVSWTFSINRPGKFAVSAPVAAVGGTSKVVIVTDRNELPPVSIPNTGDYARFRPLRFGEVNIAKAGPCTLTVKPVPANWSPINLRAITLTPVGE